jgi:rhamnosyltransferase
MSEKIPRVTVIMRCKNSDWVISQALAALFSQSYTDFELLVVDSGSTDKTLDIVKQYPHRLIQIEPTQYYPGSVLNMAIEKARGEIIVFQNSDTVPLRHDTLGNLLQAFDDPDNQAALTRQIPRPEADTWVRRDYAQSFPDNENTPEWITLSLPMAAMRKSIWQQHPFYTDAWASEDTEWGQWAVNNGHKIKYVKDALVMHSHNYSLKQVYGRKFVEGEADAFIYDKKACVFRSIKRITRMFFREILLHIKEVDLKGLVLTPARLFVSEKAHYQGLNLGHKRRLEGDTDPSKGQVTILSYYNDGRKQ